MRGFSASPYEDPWTPTLGAHATPFGAANSEPKPSPAWGRGWTGPAFSSAGSGRVRGLDTACAEEVHHS